MEDTNSGREQAEALLLRFTGAATITGAIPVPAASAAIVAENAAMIAAIGSAMAVKVSVQSVAASLGTVGAVNMVGRALFVEAARFMGWFAGPFGVWGVSVLGATTAGLQTWCLGRLAIAIAEHAGEPLEEHRAREVLSAARETFSEIREDAKRAAKREPVEKQG